LTERWSLKAQVGETWRLDRMVTVFTSRETERPAPTAAEHLAYAFHGADALVRAHRDATRARVTQLLDLMLAPDLQAAVLDLESVDGVEPTCERSLRTVAHQESWAAQRASAAASLLQRCRRPGAPTLRA
jgi:hypothetical protein